MPEFYDAPKEVRDVFFPKAIGERIIGTDDRRREEKTFLPDQQTVILLSIIRNTARRVIRMLQVAHKRYYGEDIGEEQVIAKYQSAASWVGFHNDLVSHYNSHLGYGIKMAVRAEEMRMEEQFRRETATQQGVKPNDASGSARSPNSIVESR